MITLVEAEVNKYKSFSTIQNVKFDPKITTLVGMNESGKTAFLEALAKVNYFMEDKKFKFDTIQDYPRKELKTYQKKGTDETVIKCKFSISDELLSKIQEDVGESTFTVKEFEYSVKYGGGVVWNNLTANEEEYIKHSLEDYSFKEEIKDQILSIKKLTEIPEIVKTLQDESTKKSLNDIYNKVINNAYEFKNRIEGYIAKKWINPNLPKFWYYDEYYSLPSRINLSTFNASDTNESVQTTKALFEMAEIDLKEILEKSDFERFKAELESTSIHITEQIFKYWSANKNLDIKFDIDSVEVMRGNQKVIDKYLDVRIFNNHYKMSLPLAKRSKGFNWFFSFIIWFGKIQADRRSNYILLLDEPGLNLHATAQADLLKFIDDLSINYQLIYTTHSPFMIDSNHLERIRTVVETEDGSVISETIQEKDPKTLFPLQAALGYDIAQNLFISKNNLLVEGPSDLLYLTTISAVLEANNREGLKDNVTIVPVGGLDKVATFISLLAASKLNLVCLLDNFTDMKGKQRVEDLIKYKIIKGKNIRFFGEFSSLESKMSDIEDIFTKEEYLKLYNEEFTSNIKIEELAKNKERIIEQITLIIGKRFNHYRLASLLTKKGVDITYFSKRTLDRFENMFKEINKLF